MALFISRLWRLLSILAAMALALVIGLTVFFLLTRFSLGRISGAGVIVPELKAFMAGWFDRTHQFFPVALAVAAFGVVFTEFTEMRQWAAHALSAAFCAALTLFIVVDVHVLTVGNQVATALQSLVAAFIAGIAYWAVAGRTAGLWRQ
jgi:hypothetical protein